MYCENCGNQILDETKPCSSCGQMPEIRYEAGDGPSLTAYPMKWYKFLIYFSLFFSAVMNLLAVPTYITGTVYGANVYYLYTLYPALKFVTILYGLFLIAIAVYSVITRFALAKFKENGPKMLYILYVAPVVADILYSLFSTIVIGVNCFNIGSMFGSIVGTAIVIWLNYKYFKKREAYFVY